jgi:hypothetical protein
MNEENPEVKEQEEQEQEQEGQVININGEISNCAIGRNATVINHY